MKKYLNILIGLFLFLILSCNTETKQKSEEKAYLSIKIDGKERTVLPQTFDLENDFDLSFEFSGYYTKDESVKITKTWKPTESETAYTLMTKDTEILLDTTGLWKFSLTIKKENKQLYAEEISYRIEPGENKLKFNLSYAKEGDGDLEIKLNFAKDANVKAVMAELFIFGKEEEFCEKEKLEIKTENDKSYVLYSKKEIPTDSYLVKFEFYGDEEATLFMNLYTEVVQIVANHTSSAERTIEHLNSFYEIEYKLDNTAGEEFTEGFEPETKYSPYNLPVLPKAKNVKKEGYVFAGWKNEKGEVFTKLPEGTKGNLFLTATWLEGKEIELDEAENFDYSTITEEDIIFISGEKKSGDSSLWKSLINNLNNLEIKINLNMSLVENLNTISSSLFKDFDNLVNITIPDSVKEIGIGAFFGCIALEKLNLGENIEAIGRNAFLNCKALKSIIISDKVKEINEYVFSGCSALEEIVIGANVETIGSSAFLECTSLKSIIIPDSVKAIGSSAFYGCSALEEIVIGANVETLETMVFSKCSSLKKIIIPESVKTIELYVFSECDKLEKVELGKNIETIGDECFEKCSSLEEIIIPDSVKIIGSSTFAFCSALTKIEIGANVEKIGKQVFQYCTALEEITFRDTTDWYRNNDYSMSYENGTLIDVSNSEENVNLLTKEENYLLYYFYKK